MRPLLARAEQPVDLVGRRIVAADGHVGLGGEVELAAGEPQSVRASERAQLDVVQLFPGRDVDDREGVAPALAIAAVIAREREFPVVGDGQLVGVLPDGDAAHHLAVRRIDDGHRVLALVKDEKGGRWRLLRNDGCLGYETDNQ